ncbi:MAG TPA: hypothetical protein VLA54_05965 [Acidimicrobiia bacterium]|jgi:hypothetical protein|nr:hypothetical protein [Acidimicrobiia bacterium]
MPVPADLHDYIAFADPDEDKTWMFDASFLRSSWTCIYGRGCQGIYTTPTPELQQGCCSMGAWFVDDADLQNVEKHAALLTDDNWQHRRKAGERFWRRRGKDDKSTRLVGDACIFLNRPGFGAGAGCALHLGALQAGERPLDWKPNVCWQLPLRLEEETDSHGHTTAILREWKRRDWGDGGKEFAWWCTDSPLAFVGGEPVYRSLRQELVELVGGRVYKLLVNQLEKGVPVPHPVLKRKGVRRPPSGPPTTPVQG